MSNVGRKIVRNAVGRVRFLIGRRPQAAARSRRDREAGFTLVEMLVVLAIIGMVVGLVGPRVVGYLGDSKVKTARVQIQSFAAALDLYYLDNGRYPSTSDGLAVLVQKPANATRWNGPYLKANAVPADPWGRPYVYRQPGEHGPYDISSLGADGQGGGDVTASINNWQQ